MSEVLKKVPTDEVVAALYNDLRSRVEAVEPNDAMVAPDYADLTMPILVGTRCTHNRGLYKCNTQINSSEAWDSTHWDEITVGSELDSLQDEVDDKYEKPSGGIPASDIASGVIPDVSGKTDQGAVATPYGSLTWPVTAGQYCFQNGYVYRAKQNIATSESWTAAHWDQVVLGDEVCRAMNAIQGLDDDKYEKPSGGIPSSDMTSVVQISLDKADTAYQKPSSGIPSTDMTTAAQTSLAKADSAYQKPVSGIPKTDLAVAVQTSLGKADTALQGVDVTAAVDAWLDDNITNPNSPPLDRSLSSASSAAPADLAGKVKDTADSLEAFCKKETTDVTEGSINVTSGVDVQKTEHIVTINISSGTEYKFKLIANSRITKYHFYADETIVQYNCDPETEYTFTAESNISNISIYCTGTQVVGTGSIKGIVTIVTENSNSLEERMETAESEIDSLEDNVDNIHDDLESLEVFCRKEITDVTKGSINVTSGVDVQITEHLVDVNVANGTEYRFKIEANGKLTKYHLYINGSVLQYNCVPETVYTFTAETNITYFSIYCAGDVVIGTGEITGIVTIPTETTGSLEERLDTVEDEIEEVSSINDAFTGAKILDMSDIRNSYVEGSVGNEIVFRPTTASKSIVNIIKVKEGLSYKIKVTYGSEIASSSTRGNYIVDDENTVLQNFGMSATASTTIESNITAVADGFLILVVDSGYTGIEIIGLIDSNDIEAIDKKISGDSAEGILTDLIKARMITCITYFLWTNIHGEELLQSLCDSMGVDGWCDVRPKTGINSTTGQDEPAEVYRQASDYIDVTGTASIQSALSDSLQYPVFYAIRCYDSNKDFIGTAESDAGTTSALNGNVKRNLVTDTKYIRFLFSPDPISRPTQNLAGVYTGRMLRMELTDSSNVTTIKRFTLREVEEFRDDL